MSFLTTLHWGVVVPDDALRLAWALEERGYLLTADAGTLRVKLRAGWPPSPLSDEDKALILHWKVSLLAVADYTPLDLVG